MENVKEAVREENKVFRRWFQDRSGEMRLEYNILNINGRVYGSVVGGCMVGL